VSLVWLVPAAALLMALYVAWSNYSERGPLIEIVFNDAAGIAPGETEVRYRNVAVGLVEDIGFTSDLGSVAVKVRLDSDVAPFVDEGAQFWIVRPTITASEISGLDTVLSGNYIEGYWDTEAGGLVERFEGLIEPPLLTSTQDGLRIELRSSFDAGFVENTPILYKGVEVGRLGSAEVSVNGEWVFADAIIFAPHDRLITTSTRFWDTSGFRFTLGPQGANVDFDSISSLLSGGLTFDSLVSGGAPIREDSVFTVYPDEQSARDSVFEGSDRSSVTVSAIFPENVSGLSSDAAVEWRGVRIGRVANVTGVVDRLRFGDDSVRLLATLELRPSRIGLSGTVGPDDVYDFLDARIAEGLRARLVSASILTGGLKVELLTVEEAEPFEFDRTQQPFPMFPTVDSEISDVSATAEGVFERINALPVEELLESAIAFLDNATALAADQALRETPAEIKGLIEDARAVIGSDAIQAIPDDIAATMENVRSAAEDISTMLNTLAEAETAMRLSEAIASADEAAKAATVTLNELPALTGKLSALADKATALPIEQLIAEATEVTASASDILASDATRAIPEELRNSIASLSSLLSGLEDGGAVTALIEAVEATEVAAADVSGSVEGVAELVETLNQIATTANGLPLEKLVGEATRAVEAAADIVASEDTQAIPASLRGALADLETVVASLAEADAGQQLADALTAAREAAENVSASTERVPDIIARIDAIAAKAETMPLDAIGVELEGALASIRRLTGDAADAQLPENLSGALAEVEAAVAELRAGGLIDNANETLASARTATEAIANAANQLPALASRLSRTLGQAERTLLTYDDRSDVNRELNQLLRDVQEAARAIEQLARTIERKPNSLILGR
jgi:paraquat-inducible protein B